MPVSRAQESNKTRHKNTHLEGEEGRKGGKKLLSPCETSDRKQDWRKVANDAGLGSAGQTAHHAPCEKAATELLLDININKEMEV